MSLCGCCVPWQLWALPHCTEVSVPKRPLTAVANNGSYWILTWNFLFEPCSTWLELTVLRRTLNS